MASKKPGTENDDAAAASGAGTGDTMAGATDQMRQARERMQATASAMSDTGSQLGLKMLEQAETNTGEAFKAMRAAAQANDLGEVMRIQSDFLREQGSRSVSQAREIGEMIADFGRMTMGQMTGWR